MTLSPGVASAPGSVVSRSRRGLPLWIAATASRRTRGWEQLPPIQPISRPSAVTIALSPTWDETGGLR